MCGVIINSSRDGLKKEKTIVVVGVARGGTSIVSGSLAHLGVFSGNATCPVFEDLRLSLAFEKKSDERFKEVVDAYNLKYDVWAWKRPSTLNKLKYISKNLRNPYFIFVFRDIFSIAKRNNEAMRKDLYCGLDDAIKDYRKIVRFIKKTSCPALLLSSEKAVSKKEEFIKKIIEFTNISPTEKQIDSALSFISADPIDYLQKTHIDSVVGWVDHQLFKNGKVKGWVKYIHNLSKPVEVELWVNGTVKACAIANLYDESYAKPHISESGEVGFYFDLDALSISPQDIIEVRAVGDIAPFYQEPLVASGMSTWMSLEDVARLVKPSGGVNRDYLQTGVLMGWARTENPDHIAMVGVYVNGVHFATLPACIYRPHLKAPNIHPTGHCGYQIDLKPLGVSTKDLIEVKIENSNITLTPEPICFENLNEWLTPQKLKELNQKKKG